MRSILPYLAMFLFTLSFYLSKTEDANEQKAYAQVLLPNLQQPAADNTDTAKEEQEGAILQAWFNKYSCPLGSQTEVFIQQATAHSLDFRLLPAIAFRESTCDKYKTDNNALGFGSYQFDNQDAVIYVAKAVSGEGTIDAKYYLKAHKDPQSILRIYNTRPSYIKEVLEIMEEIK